VRRSPGLRSKAWLLVTPAAAVFASLFVVPFGYFFLVSFWRFRSYKLVHDLTMDNYREVASDYLWLVGFTLLIATTIASVALVLGFLYAYLIRFKAGRFGPALLFLAILTLFGGYLMKVYAWRTILGREGIINNALIGFGVIREPIGWLLYNPPAVVITLTHFLFPFAVLPIFASMRGIADSEIEAARDLGASRLRILLDHVIPRSRAGLVVGFMLTFLIGCGDWVTPVLVGGRMTLIGNLIAAQFGEFLNWPLGAAMSFTVLLAAVLVIGIFAILARGVEPR
jgi:spermidine/putrescine transport system permease protein